jgi:hypothetical protein
LAIYLNRFFAGGSLFLNKGRLQIMEMNKFPVVERDEQDLGTIAEQARALVGQNVQVTFISEQAEVFGFNDGVNKFGPGYVTLQNGFTQHIPLRIVKGIRPIGQASK